MARRVYENVGLAENMTFANGSSNFLTTPLSNAPAVFLGYQCFPFPGGPEVLFYVDPGFDHWNAFGFEELLLEGGIGFADEDFAVGAQDAVPGDAFALRGGSHGAARGTCAAGETQGSSETPIG
ncbi:MAG: hypothetical protein WA789_19915 [Candidatus Acidiferrum sp.]